MRDATLRRAGQRNGRPRQSSWFARRWSVAAAAPLGLLAIAAILFAWLRSTLLSTRSAAAGLISSAAARQLLVPSYGDMFGAWVRPTSGFGPGAEEAAVLALEKTLGRKLAIDQLYVPWAAPLPLAGICIRDAFR